MSTSSRMLRCERAADPPRVGTAVRLRADILLRHIIPRNPEAHADINRNSIFSSVRLAHSFVYFDSRTLAKLSAGRLATGHRTAHATRSTHESHDNRQRTGTARDDLRNRRGDDDRSLAEGLRMHVDTDGVGLERNPGLRVERAVGWHPRNVSQLVDRASELDSQ